MSIDERLQAGELSIDEEQGDLLKDGVHVLRAGKTVAVTRWGGREVTEHSTVAKAKGAFKDAAP